MLGHGQAIHTESYEELARAEIRPKGAAGTPRREKKCLRRRGASAPGPMPKLLRKGRPEGQALAGALCAGLIDCLALDQILTANIENEQKTLQIPG